MLRFSDGVEFDTTGKFRLERRSDGYYVVGNGLLIPVNDRDEGYEEIERLEKRAKDRAKRT